MVTIIFTNIGAFITKWTIDMFFCTNWLHYYRLFSIWRLCDVLLFKNYLLLHRIIRKTKICKNIWAIIQKHLYFEIISIRKKIKRHQAWMTHKKKYFIDCLLFIHNWYCSLYSQKIVWQEILLCGKNWFFQFGQGMGTATKLILFFIHHIITTCTSLVTKPKSFTLAYYLLPHCAQQQM